MEIVDVWVLWWENSRFFSSVLEVESLRKREIIAWWVIQILKSYDIEGKGKYMIIGRLSRKGSEKKTKL